MLLDTCAQAAWAKTVQNMGKGSTHVFHIREECHTHERFTAFLTALLKHFRTGRLEKQHWLESPAELPSLCGSEAGFQNHLHGIAIPMAIAHSRLRLFLKCRLRRFRGCHRGCPTMSLRPGQSIQQ
jgi:hypothetical protein